MHWGGVHMHSLGGVAWLKYVKASGSSGTQFRNCRCGGCAQYSLATRVERVDEENRPRAFDPHGTQQTVPLKATLPRGVPTVPPLQFGLQRWGVRLHLFLAGSRGVLSVFFLAFELLLSEGPAPGVVRLLHQSVRAPNGLQRSVEGQRECPSGRAHRQTDAC
jgi:hypothetical protein